MPRLLRGLIRAELEKDERIEIAGESDSAADVARLVQTLRPGVLVLGVTGPLDGAAVCRLLLQEPTLRVVAVRDDGHAVEHVELAVRVVDPTPAAIRAAIVSRSADSAD